MSDDPNIIKTRSVNEKPAPATIMDGEAKIVGRFDAEQSQQIRERQKARSNMMGMILLGLCVLFFAITIVKIGVWG